MNYEFFPYSRLTAEGQVRRQTITEILKANPSEDILGTILLCRMKSKLEVIEASRSPEVPQPGIYESTRYESGTFIVRAIHRVIDIRDGEKRDEISVSGGFTHIKPSVYDPKDPLIPGRLVAGDSVSFNVARLRIHDLDAPGPLTAQLQMELGGEESPYDEGAL